jgi:hypothetical protein
LDDALRIAVGSNNMSVVQVLLDTCAVGDLHDALCVAASGNNMSLVQLFLSAGAQVNSQRYGHRYERYSTLLLSLDPWS